MSQIDWRRETPPEIPDGMTLWTRLPVNEKANFCPRVYIEYKEYGRALFGPSPEQYETSKFDLHLATLDTVMYYLVQDLKGPYPELVQFSEELRLWIREGIYI